MKNVLLMLVLFSGLAISSASAQSCKPANCAPCPPGCCIINCCTSTGTAADVNGKSESESKVTYASLVAYDAAGKEIKISKKEMKACMASCKKANVATETSTAANCQPSPSCQPNPACKSAAQKEASALPVYKASLSKS